MLLGPRLSNFFARPVLSTASRATECSRETSDQILLFGLAGPSSELSLLPASIFSFVSSPHSIDTGCAREPVFTQFPFE